MKNNFAEIFHPRLYRNKRARHFAMANETDRNTRRTDYPSD